MRPDRHRIVAHRADTLSLNDVLTFPDRDPSKTRVSGAEAILVVDLNVRPRTAGNVDSDR